MAALPDALAGVSARIGQMTALDAPAEFVQRIVRSTFGSGRLDEILGGEPLTHPLHPALVAIPVGSWLSASILDVTGADARAARGLIAFGCLAAVPTAASGARDWSRTVGEQRRIGFAHALLNDAALFTYGASWLAAQARPPSWWHRAGPRRRRIPRCSRLARRTPRLHPARRRRRGRRPPR